MTEKHLERLSRLEQNNNINDIHKLLCGSQNSNLIETSRLIVDLYEVAESEREPEIRRTVHGIDDATYPTYANYKRSFFRNPFAQDAENSLVELEYFLDLLYSISFSLYVSLKNCREFNLSLLQANKTHLPAYEHCLNTLQDLYVTLDTLSVVIALVCAVDTDLVDIEFRKAANYVENSPLERNFTLSDFNVNVYPINLLNRIRNMRAHRPFLDWDDDGNIVSEPNDLSKVKSVCGRQNLYNKSVQAFVQDAFSRVIGIVKEGLRGVFKTYIDRLESKATCNQPHERWEKFLS